MDSVKVQVKMFTLESLLTDNNSFRAVREKQMGAVLYANNLLHYAVIMPSIVLKRSVLSLFVPTLNTNFVNSKLTSECNKINCCVAECT